QILFEISFSFIGTEKVVKGEIQRNKCPQTFEAIRDKTREKGFFTVRSRGNIGSKRTYWMILINLRKGGEKDQYKNYKTGDIVYCPRQDALFLILDNPKINYPAFYIGKITEGIENLSNLQNGVMCKIELKDIT
ncbi:MAG: hypothetical protein ACTSPA_12885, partial [Promethearchaeota archaeon]